MPPSATSGGGDVGKPRVLLSILKCSCVESYGDQEQLYTAICAGFGRFECDRLLKPSGVELMNLPLTASIEISVLRRDSSGQIPTSQRQLLCHGVIPLSALSSTLLASTAGGDPQVWENWVGMFGADVSLQTQSPEHMFQRCLDMGASNARLPRLLIRLQYLRSGVQRVGGAVPSEVSSDPTQSSLSQQVRSLENVKELSTKAGVVQSSASGGTLAADSPADAFNGLSSEPAPLQSNTGVGKDLQGSGCARLGSSSLEESEWREKYLALAQLMSESQEIAGIDSGPQEQPDSNDDRSKLLLKVAASVKQISDLRRKTAELERENSLLRERDRVREFIEQDFLAQIAPSLERFGLPPLRVASLQAPEDIASGSSGTDSVRARLAEVSSALASASEAFPYAEARDAVSSTGITACENSLPAVLADKAVMRAIDGGESDFETWFSLECTPDERNRLEQAGGLLASCRRAASLKSAAATVASADMVARTTLAPSAMPPRSVSSLREESGGGEFSMISCLYTPVKTDPVDCLVAANLLRLGLEPQSLDIERLEPGVYRVGRQGQTVRCLMDHGRVMVTPSVTNADIADGSPAARTELSVFLLAESSRTTDMAPSY